jgi:hypothetical protein
VAAVGQVDVEAVVVDGGPAGGRGEQHGWGQEDGVAPPWTTSSSSSPSSVPQGRTARRRGADRLFRAPRDARPPPAARRGGRRGR